MPFDVVEYGVRGFLHGACLSGCQGGEEEFAHASDVGGGRGADGGDTSLGEADEGCPEVIGAGVAANVASLLHASDVVGQAALLPLQLVTELTSPNGAVRCLGEDGEDLVVGDGHGGVDLQPLGEGGGELGVHPYHAAPGVVVLLVQPLSHDGGSLGRWPPVP